MKAILPCELTLASGGGLKIGTPLTLSQRLTDRNGYSGGGPGYWGRGNQGY